MYTHTFNQIDQKSYNFLQGVAKNNRASPSLSFEVLESQYENLARVASQNRYSNTS